MESNLLTYMLKQLKQHNLSTLFTVNNTTKVLHI